MEVCMHEPLDDYLRRSREAINQNDFELAKDNLLKAIDLDPKSAQVMNLVGVMLEMDVVMERSSKLRSRKNGGYLSYLILGFI